MNFAQRHRYAQPHAVCQIQFDLLKLGIGLKLRALRQVFVVEHDVIPIHDVDVAVIVNRHAPQLLNDEVEIDLYADDAEEMSFEKHRRHIRNDVRFRGGIDVRLNPRRAFALQRNVIPTDILSLVGRIKRKVGDFTLDERRQRAFPTHGFARHEKSALGSAKLRRQMQVISDAAVRPARNVVEALTHGGEVRLTISGIVLQSFVAFDGVDRLTLHAVDRLSNTEERPIQTFSTDDAHRVQ